VKILLLAFLATVLGCAPPCNPGDGSPFAVANGKIIDRETGVGVGVALSAKPLAAGVVVSLNDCNSLGTASQSLTAAECAPATGDAPCAKCLRASCCELTLEWFDGKPDNAELASCVESHCMSPCTRKP
jgi:hypothetical protein